MKGSVVSLEKLARTTDRDGEIVGYEHCAGNMVGYAARPQGTESAGTAVRGKKISEGCCTSVDKT